MSNQDDRQVSPQGKRQGFDLTTDFPMAMEGHPINPHFANVLKILDIWDNSEDEKEIILAVLENFFLMMQASSGPVKEPLDIQLAVELFCRFLAEGKAEADTEAGSIAGPTAQLQTRSQTRATDRQFCFKFDAKEIYADFLREYSIDLLSVEYLHWHKFSILLQGLSDKSSLKQKIALRFLDLSQFKGKVRSDYDKAKQSVQLPLKLNKVEMDYVQEMREKLRQGKK